MKTLYIIQRNNHHYQNLSNKNYLNKLTLKKKIVKHIHLNLKKTIKKIYYHKTVNI